MSRFILALALSGLLAACAALGKPAQTPDAEGAADSGSLVDTARLPADFVWRQRIDVRYRDRHESFQAVVEKHGPRLILLGLTPFGTRAFALEQVGTAVTYTPFVQLELPFPPRYILADVHRTFFRGIQPPPASDGRHEADIDGEHVTEQWANQRLLSREYRSTQPGQTAPIRITYQGGMQGSTPPRELTFDNQRFGYELTIRTLP